MFKMRVVQAQFGDCFLLEYGTAASPHFLLVDGGPPNTFHDHLEFELEAIAAQGGKLDLVMLSHVDNDHAIGLLDLVARLRADAAGGTPPLIGVDGLWHNSFARTIDPNGILAPRLRAASTNGAMVQAAAAVQGIGEGNSLRLGASALQIPLNAGFAQGLICVDDQPAPLVLGNLTLQVVGPTQANLAELKAEWEAWLDDHDNAVASGNPQVMANSDRSIPNLSSIMVMAEAHGKRVLCTGDGRSDHLLKGLKQAGLLDAAGGCHVDVLKVAHHGSDRNATRTFFRKVTADSYVISANGKHGNPDTATLTWIVEEAHAGGRAVNLLVTNDTPSTKKLVQDFPPAQLGYTLRFLGANDHSSTLVLQA